MEIMKTAIKKIETKPDPYKGEGALRIAMDKSGTSIFGYGKPLDDFVGLNKNLFEKVNKSLDESAVGRQPLPADIVQTLLRSDDCRLMVQYLDAFPSLMNDLKKELSEKQCREIMAVYQIRSKVRKAKTWAKAMFEARVREAGSKKSNPETSGLHDRIIPSS
ncbi:MAG TPA: hypothetical protein PLO51_05860 [Candidatus Micrarchaeota archaeon]|nr:hypothetical protein [Candidatus Micrarchaeota archaeon]